MTENSEKADLARGIGVGLLMLASALAASIRRPRVGLSVSGSALRVA